MAATHTLLFTALALLTGYSFQYEVCSKPLSTPVLNQYSDPTQSHTFASIQKLTEGNWRKVVSPNFGRRGGYGWVKFAFTSREDQILWLEIQSHFIDTAAVYLIEAKLPSLASSANAIDEKLSGTVDTLGYERQPVLHRYFLHALHLQKGKVYTVYVRGHVLPPEELKMPIHLWKPAEFLEHSRRENWGWALFIGIILVTVSFSLANFAMQRPGHIYLYFAGYVAFVSVYAIFNDGWCVFMPDFMRPLDRTTVLGHWINGGLGFLLLFSRRFLAIDSVRGGGLLSFNPLWITLAVEVCVVAAHLGEWWGNILLFRLAHGLGYTLLFGYLILWVSYLADAIRRGFKPVWLHMASVLTLVGFLCFNVLIENAGWLDAHIPDMLVLRVALVVDIGFILISWVYRQKVIDQESRALSLENLAHQQAVAEAIQRQQAEAIRVMGLEKENQQQRMRLARDLHDGIGSELAHIINRLDILAFSSEQPQSLLSLGEFTRATNQNLRDTLWILNQPHISARQWQDRLLFWLSKIWEDREQPRLLTHLTAPDELSLSPSVANGAFRIAQEAVNNALKYANSHTIRVCLTIEGNLLQLSISDDGGGFDTSLAGTGYGLPGMHHRARELDGCCQVHSDETGTSVKVSLPLE